MADRALPDPVDRVADVDRRDRGPALIVDEAQNLPMSALEELRMLSNFQVDNVAPFQTFLVGQPQFRSMLASADLEQLRQRVIASYHLGPMNREECGDYLIHRLRQVGWSADPSFDPIAFAGGARAAFTTIVEAFARGDSKTLRPLLDFITDTTDPYLNLFRRFLPPLGAGGMSLDLSPIVGIFVLLVAQALVVSAIRG